MAETYDRVPLQGNPFASGYDRVPVQGNPFDAPTLQSEEAKDKWKDAMAFATIVDPMGTPVSTDAASATKNLKDMGMSAVGLGAGAAQYGLGVPQLVAHGVKAAVPSVGTPMADAMDKSVDWLAQPRGNAYDVSREVSTYATPLLAMLATGGLAAPASISMLRNAAGQFTGAVRQAAGPLARLGETGAAAVTNGLMSLFRPVEHADQGYWGQKAAQEAIDVGLGAGGQAMNAVAPYVSSAAKYLGNSTLGKLSGVGGAAGLGTYLFNNPGQIYEMAKDAMNDPTKGIKLAIPGLFALLKTPVGQRYLPSLLGTGAQEIMNQDAPY